MNKDEMLQFIRTHPVFQLGTIDGDKPRVRTISLYRADNDGIMFYTRTFKDVHKQLTLNPEVELCFARSQPAAEIRISGRVEQVEDELLKKQINPDDPETVAIYLLKHGKATMWSIETADEPKTFLDL